MSLEKKIASSREVVLSEEHKKRIAYDEDYLRGYKDFLKEKFPLKLEEYENLIDRVDFESIQKIFYERLKKSEIEPQTFNLISSEDLQLVPHDFMPTAGNTVSAAYDLLKNKIVVPVGESAPALPIFVHNLIHELTHAYGHTSAHFTSQDRVHLKSGLKSASQNFEMQTHAELFEGLNEGITERIAQEICIEYAKQSGDRELLTELEDLIAEYDSGNTPHRYGAYMSFVDEIVRRISSYSHVPTDIVWNAVTKHYFNGEPVFTSSKVEFATIFGDDFVKDLSRVGNRTSIDDVFYTAGLYEMPEPKKGWQDEWLRHLGIDVSVDTKDASAET